LPSLKNWWVQNFTESDMIIKLNFTNPLFVSTGDERDILRITFEQPSLFKSQLDGLTLVPEYTIKGKIPGQMVSEEEFASKQGMVQSAQSTMEYTVIVPLVLQLFVSMSMNLIWGLFNTLQLITNIKNLSELIKTPAAVTMLIEMVDVTVNFKIMEQAFVKKFMQAHMKTIEQFLSQ